MNKHTVIVIIASIVIAGTLGYSLWNVFAIYNLQIASAEEGKFAYFDLMNNGKISMCNSLPFYVNIDKFEIVIFYDDEQKGTVTATHETIPPQSSTIIEGEFRSDFFVDAQYLFLHLDGEFSGDQPIRIDPTKMFVVTNVDSPIIGVIPYTISQQYTGFDFYNMMKDRTDFSC
ncbi:MAG TPA: thr operon leader peptide [Nitrosopumilaceae archaeon]|nr:thr operon leader peptide [Nitrosopumilaceae archaeon]